MFGVWTSPQPWTLDEWPLCLWAWVWPRRGAPSFPSFDYSYLNPCHPSKCLLLHQEGPQPFLVRPKTMDNGLTSRLALSRQSTKIPTLLERSHCTVRCCAQFKPWRARTPTHPTWDGAPTTPKGQNNSSPHTTLISTANQLIAHTPSKPNVNHEQPRFGSHGRVLCQANGGHHGEHDEATTGDGPSK